MTGLGHYFRMPRFRTPFAVDNKGMSQQGERPAAHEDDWWRRLYDESAPDAGASQAADSLDDRFDSASGAVGAGGGEAYEAAAAVPEPRVATSAVTRTAYTPPDVLPDVSTRAPWEPPSGPPRPRTFTTPTPAPAPLPPAPPAPVVPPEPVLPPEPPAPPRPGTDPRIAQSLPPAPAAAPSAAPDGVVPPLPRRPVVERPQAEPSDDGVPAGPAPAADPPPAAGEAAPRPPVGHVGARPPTYDAEPTALPACDPYALDDLAADTVLDGARYGTYTLRAASVRGDSARFRGEPRRDALLTVRFGTGESTLVLVAVAGGARSSESAHLAAADACRWIGEAVGRSHARLSDDIRAAAAATSNRGCTGSPTAATASCAPAPPNSGWNPTRTRRGCAASCCPPTPPAAPGSSSEWAAAGSSGCVTATGRTSNRCCRRPTRSPVNPWSASVPPYPRAGRTTSG